MSIWKNKPLLIGGGVVVVGVVLLASAGGGKAATGSVQYMTVPNGQSDAQLAAARDIQVASISANAAASANNAQLAMTSQQLQADLAKTQLQAQLAQYSIDADNARADKELTVNADITRLQITSQSDNQRYLAGMQESVAKYTLDQAYAVTRNNNEFQLEYAEQANTSAVMNAQINAQVLSNQLAANRDVTLGVLTSQAALETARLAASRDVAIASITTDAAIIQNNNASILALEQMQYNAQIAQTNAVVGSLDLVKKKSRDDVLKSLVTGDYGYSGAPGPSGTSQIISAVGGAAGNIAKLFAGF